MNTAGFETSILARKRQKTHALERAATGIGPPGSYELKIQCIFKLYTAIRY